MSVQHKIKNTWFVLNLVMKMPRESMLWMWERVLKTRGHSVKALKSAVLLLIFFNFTNNFFKVHATKGSE